MSEKQETVADICRERRAMYHPHERRCEPGWRQVCETKWAFYDRILAAHEREIAEMVARIALLEKALKPVMKLDMSKFGFLVDYGECFEAVRKAQRIMKEGENNG